MIALVGTVFAGGFTATASALAAMNPAAPGSIHTDSSDEAGHPIAPLLVIAPQDPVLAVGADEYVFEVLVRNPLTEELPGGTLSLQLATERLEGTEELTEFEAGAVGETPTVPVMTRLVEFEVDPTEAAGEQAFTVSVPSAELPLSAISAPGVYGVQAELHLDTPASLAASTADSTTGSVNGAAAGSATDSATDSADGAAEVTSLTSLTATTTAVWRGTSFGQRLPLTVVVPMMLPDEVRSMPTRADLSDAAPRLDELLTAAEEWSATLAVDPRIIAGIRTYGDAAPEPARDLLTRLEETSLPILLLQFADADPAAQAALGFDELLQPLGLGFLTQYGSFETPAPDENGGTDGDEDTAADETDATRANTTDGATDIDTGKPDASNTDTNSTGADGADPDVDANEGSKGEPEDVPDDPRTPSLGELLDWPQAQLGAWPANGDVDAATLALLKKSGIEQLILESGNVSGADTSRARVNGFDALIASASLGEAATAAIGGATEIERASGLAALAAQLAFGAQPAIQTHTEDDAATDAEDDAAIEPKPLLLALDRGTLADAESPAQLLQSLDDFDWVRPLPADELGESSGKLQPGEVAADRTELLAEALKQSREIDELSPLLEQPGYLIQYQRTRLLNIFATRYAVPDASTLAMEQATRSRDKALLAGVQIVPSENTQLVGTTSNVPVLVRNSLPFDAAVTLRASPTSAAIALPERRFHDESVEAESNATVLVPVRTRVSSGSSGLLVQVADARDDAIYDASVLHLTIRSSYETILLITLGGLAVILLGLGVWRSILRRKNQRPTPQTSLTSDPNISTEPPSTQE